MPPIPVPIIDSHIHLYPQSELDTLAWAQPHTPLYRQHSLPEYHAATAPSSHDLLCGFIFIEADRRNCETEPDAATGWKHPLQEVAFVARIIAAAHNINISNNNNNNSHRARQGHNDLVLGIVPWAPVSAGTETLARYLGLVRRVCETEGRDRGVWGRVKGVRYLLQDKPDGRMLEDQFVEGVKFLGQRGLVFDVGVDSHRRGRAQLEELVALVERAHEVADRDKVTFVLNHLCKPDLTVANPQTDPSFIAWRTAIFTLSKADNVFIKISGAFSEMSPDLANASPDAIFEAIHPWLSVVVATFGPARMLYGSDWPVCTVGVDGAWDKWRLVVELMCCMYSFDEEQTRDVFSGTARRAYRIG